MSHEWTFQKKVVGGFVVMVCVAVVTALVAIYALRAVITSKDAVLSIHANGLIDAAKLDAAIDEQVAGFRAYVVSPEERFLKQWDQGRNQSLLLLDEFSRRTLTDDGNRLVAEIRKSQQQLAELQERAIRMRNTKAGLEGATQIMLHDAIPIRERLGQQTQNYVELNQRLLEEAKQRSTADATSAMRLVIALACFAVLFATVTAFFLSRALTRQVGSAVQHVQSSSAELQSTANQQATGARETASAMSEVTTTMGELLVTTRQISESAQRVAHMAQETASAAHSGDEMVAKMQEAIGEIRQQVDEIVSHMLDLGRKSQQIGGILDIINELAEQTNILSINATIEAAGAGEAGKRFAVVGDEIRKLADRVSGSTKEIRGLVEEIRGAVNTTVLATEGGSKAVDVGLRHFEDVNKSFKQITSLVGTTTEAAQEIELGTKQQTTAVEQVNSAIAGAAQAARETETSTSQTLQTATQLAHLSHDLSQIVRAHAAAA
ncbi:MAG TPA: methyl-accepting chemotaxis protein [Terriglobales bacterium]|nr:methyl-accepting chemotaxis protein [Terriglobales bacterium]